MEQRFRLGTEMKTVLALLCRQMEGTPLCEEMEGVLSSTQFWVLEYLFAQEDRAVYQRDIERAFGVKRSTVTGILQGLEGKGLIWREAVAEDARLKKLSLTPKAIEMHQTMMLRSKAVEAKVTAGISQERLDGFYEVLQKMKENLQ